MKYHLVLQLPFSSIKDYKDMVQLEEIIEGGLGDLGEVDRHDAGSGEMNIFIHTDNPKAAFDRIQQHLGTSDFMPDLKAAFRVIGEDEYTILHPAGLTHFDVV
jgi:hypothetical protein